MTPKYNHRSVFPEKLETMLTEYVILRNRVLSGVTILEIRELAFKLAKGNNLSVPVSWTENKAAGE